MRSLILAARGAGASPPSSAFFMRNTDSPMLINQAQDPNSGSFPKRAAGMASRFLARQSRVKMLTLGNVPPMVSFTFDDVPASACELGARILEQQGARGTFYVAGSVTAGPGAPAPATIEQLRTVWANGHEIGCHTFSIRRFGS